MHNKLIDMDARVLAEQAERYFIKACRFSLTNAKHARMFAKALAVREKLMDTMAIKAVVSAFDADSLAGGTLAVNGARFACAAFTQINRADVRKVYAYIVTAGETAPDSPAISDALFADTWGTAYVDAACDHVRQIVREDAGDDAALSDSIGPGYYGMPVTAMRTLFGLLDHRAIGVCLTEHALIVPVKSCAGFWFAVNDGAALPEIACQSCAGNRKNCAFCSVRSGGL